MLKKNQMKKSELRKLIREIIKEQVGPITGRRVQEFKRALQKLSPAEKKDLYNKFTAGLSNDQITAKYNQAYNQAPDEIKALCNRGGCEPIGEGPDGKIWWVAVIFWLLMFKGAHDIFGAGGPSDMPQQEQKLKENSLAGVKSKWQNIPPGKKLKFDRWVTSQNKPQLVGHYTTAYNQAPLEIQNATQTPEEFEMDLNKIPGDRIHPGASQRWAFVIAYLLWMVYSRFAGEWGDQL